MNYTGFVYIWFDRKRKWFCIGSHMGTIDDGYISTTGYLPAAYKKRPEDFKRKILYYHTGDAYELFQKEQYFLDKIKDTELYSVENRKNNTIRYYNMKKQALGLSGKVASELRKKYFESPEGEAWKQILSEKFKKDNPSRKGRAPWNKGKKSPEISKGIAMSEKQKNKWTEERKQTRSLLIKQNWENGIYDNRPLPSPELVEKRRKAQLAQNRKQTDYQKEKAREANSKEWIITFPNGTESHIINLNAFCKEYGLDQGNMMKVVNGKIKAHKGYKCRKHK